MKFLMLLLLSFNVLALDGTTLCEEDYPNQKMTSAIDINSLLKIASSHYLYFESKKIEDLQVLKNCLDYTVCTKNQESIVDDPKNYRLHIWTNLEPGQIRSLVENCPIKDIQNKLVVKKDGQKGQRLSLKTYSPNLKGQAELKKKANPAFYPETSANTVKVIEQLLKEKKILDAQKLVLTFWGIDLHGYKINYTGKDGNFAVTNHGKKTIEYGKTWTENSCLFMRMIRHEAEHVAQMKRAKSCGNQHNFEDHKMRERAAYLNDARFLDTICPVQKKNSLSYFRQHYFNHEH